MGKIRVIIWGGMILLIGLNFSTITFSREAEKTIVDEQKSYFPLPLEIALEKKGLIREDFEFITTYYYLKPQTDELIRILKIMLAEEEFITHEENFKPFIHFLSAVGNKDQVFLNNLKNIKELYADRARNFLEQIITQAENFTSPLPDSPENLEYLWVEFCAAGDEGIIKKIISVLDSALTEENAAMMQKIQLSLMENLPRHNKAYRFLKEENSNIKNVNEKSGILQNVISELDGLADSASSHLGRSLNHLKFEKYDEALKECKEALKIWPDYSQVYDGMARIYEVKGNRERAVIYARRSVQLSPYDDISSYNLGRLYALGSRFDEAIKYFAKALEYNPKEPNYNHALGRTYQQKGDTENAVKYFKKYLEYAPYGQNASLVRAYLSSVGAQEEQKEDIDIVLMLKQKQYKELDEYFSTLLLKKEKDKEGNSLLYEAYKKLVEPLENDYYQSAEQWLKLFENWVKESPSSHFANANVGNFYLRYAWQARGVGYGSTITKESGELFKKRLWKAKEYLEKAYNLDKQDAIVPAFLMVVAKGLNLGNEEMEKQFQRAIQADNTEYQAYNQKLEYLMPKWGGSEEEMFSFAREAALNASPDSKVLNILAKAHWEMNRMKSEGGNQSYFKDPRVWEEVKGVYNKLLQNFPYNNEIHNRFARAAYLAGDYEIASREFEIIGDNWYANCWGSLEYFQEVKGKVFGQ